MRAPFGVRASTCPLSHVCDIFRLIWSTYHGKRLAKLLSPTVVGPADPGCIWCGITEPDCSPYCATFCLGGGWCSCVFGMFCGVGLVGLPRIGIAVSFTCFCSFGLGVAGALLGVSVVSTFWFTCSVGNGSAFVSVACIDPPAPVVPQKL